MQSNQGDDDAGVALLSHQADVSRRTPSLSSAVEMQPLPDHERQSTNGHAGSNLTDLQTAVANAQRCAVDALRVSELLKVKLEAQEQQTQTDAKRRRHYWFPWLIIAVTANILLWTSMVYAIFRIDDYAHTKKQYLINTWLIFITPLIITALMLSTPWPGFFVRGRKHISEHRLPRNYGATINMINAFCCFCLVVIYLYVSAIPTYNTPKWESGVKISNSTPWPTVILTPGEYSYDLKAMNFTNSPDCQLVTTSNATFCNPGVLEQKGSNYIFNATNISPSNRRATSPADYIKFYFNLNYNSSIDCGEQSSCEADPSDFSFIIGLVDSRMSLSEAFACGLVGTVAVPAFASNAFSLTAEETSDRLDLLQLPTNVPPECHDLHKRLLAADDYPYLSYAYNIISLNSDVKSNTCDLAHNSTASCFGGLWMQFSTQVVRSTESVPGLKILDIWLNLGAIVGAIQFFGWVLGIFVA